MSLSDQIGVLLRSHGLVQQGYSPRDGRDWRTYRMRADNGARLDVHFEIKEAVWTVWISIYDARGKQADSEMFELGRSLDEFKQRLSRKLVEFDTLLETRRVPKSTHVSNKEVEAYLDAAIWTATDEDGEALDRLGYTPRDFSPAARIQALVDLQAFRGAAEELEHFESVDASSSELAYDFWLTRNRHGVGFSDRRDRYGGLVDQLTEISHEFPEVHVYETDAGQLEFE